MNLIQKVFGPEPMSIEDIVGLFDFSKIFDKQSKTTRSLNLTGATCRLMDKELKAIIVGTMKALARIPKSELSWDTALAAMMQCPLLEPVEDRKIDREACLTKPGVRVFKFDGSPDPALVNEVKFWVNALIVDPDVLNSTRMNDVETLAEIVAQTGATVDAITTIFFKEETHEMELMDVGVLRYPDAYHPYFKIYRLRLFARSQCDRILCLQVDNNGISGQFNSRQFRPRKSVVDGLSTMINALVEEEMKDLFGY